MSYKQFYIGIIMIFLIIILTFTPVIGYVPFFRRKWIFLLLGITVLSNPFQIKSEISSAFFYLAFSAIIMFLNVLSGDAYYAEKSKVFLEIAMLALVPMMTNYAIQEADKQWFLKGCIITFFAILAIETVSTFYIDRQIPGAIRLLFKESLQSVNRNEVLYPFFKLGLSNYMLPHAMPMLIPPLVMGFKDRLNPMMLRIGSFVFLLLAMELIWLSGAMAAFMMGIFFLILAVFTPFSEKPSLTFLIILGILFFPFVIFDELPQLVLKISQDIFSDNVYIYRKLLLLEENLYSEEATGDVAERQNLYLISLNEFINNIFIGTNNALGNHSAFMDRLATLGLTGFVPYITYYYIQIKSFRRYIPDLNRIYFDEAIAAGLLMLLFKDTDSWEIYLTLFTVTPLLVIFLSRYRSVEEDESFIEITE